MKSRTCPNCSYTYSLKQYLKKPFWKGVFSHWKCANCGRALTFSTSRRILLAIVGVAPAVLIPYITRFFIAADFSAVLSWTGAIILVLVWTIGVFSFEIFVLNEEPGEKINRQ